jgi:hypothetical protein
MSVVTACITPIVFAMVAKGKRELSPGHIANQRLFLIGKKPQIVR